MRVDSIVGLNKGCENTFWWVWPERIIYEAAHSVHQCHATIIAEAGASRTNFVGDQGTLDQMGALILFIGAQISRIVLQTMPVKRIGPHWSNYIQLAHELFVAIGVAGTVFLKKSFHDPSFKYYITVTTWKVFSGDKGSFITVKIRSKEAVVMREIDIIPLLI